MPGTPDASRSEANPRCGRLAEEDGDASLTEQQLGLRQAEERLARDHIHRMLKRCAEFPSFQYVCSLCSVHIENVQLAHKHIKEKRHKKNLTEKQEENELRALAPPAPEQLVALDAVVTETARRHGVSEDDVAARTHVVQRMGDIIRTQLPACSLRLYGSSMTRFAFKTSDVNIDITVPNTMTQPEVLIRVLEILKNSSEFSDVKSDFHAKVPAVFCRHASSDLLCNVSTGNELACLTTDHLAALARLEPRLVPLVLAFRHWGRLVHLDRPEEGGVSSFCLVLLVLFFLQQRNKPLVPVYLGPWVPGFQVKRADEFQLTGISDSSVHWERRPAPENRESSQGLAPLSFPVPVQASVGLLWVELLRFFSLDFPLEESVVSVRLKEALPRDAKSWPRRRLAVEDPFAVKRNVARSLNSQMVFEYLQDRLRAAYRYFANPQNAAESMLRQEVDHTESSLKQEVDNTKSLLKQEVNHTQSDHSESSLKQGVNHAESSLKQEVDHTESSLQQEVNHTESSLKQDVNHAKSSLKQEVDRTESSLQQEVDHTESTLQQEVNYAESLLKQEVNHAESLLKQEVSHTESSLKQEVDHTESSLKQEVERSLNQEVSSRKQEVKYVFDKLILTGGKPPTVVCSVCKRDGHVKDECPEDFKKTELQKLPEKNQEFFRILDRLCCSCYEELCLSPLEQQRREQILSGLERFIRKEFNDKARLCLFGSSKNGFGFHDSDLDICMTLEGHDNAEKLNCKEVMEELAKVLKKHTGLRNILPITTAKVPIVKFEHRQSGLEGDVSLYNTLAQHNTRMLATYAALDPRVQLLGYTMKVFAKRCDIGDASRGSLSSYAYILMVLYFLQQRRPPVIPVLQEMFDGDEAPRRTVDGWNAFFYDDLQQLRRGVRANAESVGELWLGLLRFYTEDFSFKEHVVSIRQRRRLTTFEKQWTSKCIAIEDPFDLNHNLGAGVSRKMTNFIMKALINGRKLFGTPFFPLPGTELEYFFDSKVLTDGELAPNDRCCRVCGKIGHYMKDCPRRRRMRKKEAERDEDVRDDERRCFQCGEPGHTRRDCPEYRHLKHRNAGGHTERGGRTRNGAECTEAPPPFLPSLLGLAQLLVAPPPPPPPIVFAQAAGGRGYRMPHPHYQLASGPTTLPPHVRHHLNFIPQKK